MGFLQLGLGGGALDCFSHIRQAPAHEHVNEEEEEEEEDQGAKEKEEVAVPARIKKPMFLFRRLVSATNRSS